MVNFNIKRMIHVGQKVWQFHITRHTHQQQILPLISNAAIRAWQTTCDRLVLTNLP